MAGFKFSSFMWETDMHLWTIRKTTESNWQKPDEPQTWEITSLGPRIHMGKAETEHDGPNSELR